MGQVSSSHRRTVDSPTSVPLLPKGQDSEKARLLDRDDAFGRLSQNSDKSRIDGTPTKRPEPKAPTTHRGSLGERLSHWIHGDSERQQAVTQWCQTVAQSGTADNYVGLALAYMAQAKHAFRKTKVEGYATQAEAAIKTAYAKKPEDRAVKAALQTFVLKYGHKVDDLRWAAREVMATAPSSAERDQGIHTLCKKALASKDLGTAAAVELADLAYSLNDFDMAHRLYARARANLAASGKFLSFDAESRLVYAADMAGVDWPDMLHYLHELDKMVGRDPVWKSWALNQHGAYSYRLHRLRPDSGIMVRNAHDEFQEAVGACPSNQVARRNAEMTHEYCGSVEYWVAPGPFGSERSCARGKYKTAETVRPNDAKLFCAKVQPADID